MNNLTLTWAGFVVSSCDETIFAGARSYFEIMRVQHGTVDQTMEFDHMLAEKFILLLESFIRSQIYTDGAPRVVSTSAHVPVKLPQQSGKS